MRELPDAVVAAIESANVPALPQALLRLLQLVDNDEVTTAALARVVEQDPGLCARVLTTANSPALRRRAELHTVESCIVALGTRLIRSMATCLSVKQMFERHQGRVRADLNDFWCHSLRVAELARALAMRANYHRPDDAYLAGLLHDVGELLMLSAFGGDYAELLTRSESETALAALETERFGIDHAEVGTWLVDHWQLDLSFADGILFHHAGAEAIVGAGLLPQLVWLAHELALCKKPNDLVAEAAGRILGAGNETGLGPLRDQAETRLNVIAKAMGVVPGDMVPGVDTIQVLPRIAAATGVPGGSASEEEIDTVVRDAALKQSLQSELFAMESDAELLLSLRESIRILFEISRIAFLLADPEYGALSGETVGGQHAVFRLNRIAIASGTCLAARAAATGAILSSYDDTSATEPPSLLDVQFSRALGSEGLLCVPMVARRRTAGVIVLGLSAAQDARLRRRLPWLRNFGRMAAVGLDAWQEARNFRQRIEDAASARFERQARRVVHEAGNPLGIIRSYLRILDGKLPEGAEVRQELDVLREEIDRVAAIVRRMSEIPAESEVGDGIDVVELVREMMTLYADALFRARGIEVVMDLADPVSRLAGDRDSIKQILLNLWKNAAEAMSEGGRLALSVCDGIVLNGAPYVEVSIEDSGPGMSAEAIRRLSQPDAEAAGEAPRGMGLAIVGTLAARLGAQLSCRSRTGVGTAISLLLPCRMVERSD